jgi:hypothetical protein
MNDDKLEGEMGEWEERGKNNGKKYVKEEEGEVKKRGRGIGRNGRSFRILGAASQRIQAISTSSV